MGLPGQDSGQRGARPWPMAFHCVLLVHGRILLQLLSKPLCDGAFLGMWMEAALRVFFRRLLGGGFRRSTATPMDAEALRLATMVAFIDASIRRRERGGLGTEATTATPMLESRIKGTEACGCTEANNGGGLGDGLV